MFYQQRLIQCFFRSGLKAKIYPKKPSISDVHQQKRLTWSREKMNGYPWKNVFFWRNNDGIVTDYTTPRKQAI